MSGQRQRTKEYLREAARQIVERKERLREYAREIVASRTPEEQAEAEEYWREKRESEETT